MGHIENHSTAPRALGTNLPRVLTSFIGRTLEIVDVTRLLASSRVVMLTGAAGCGKTRLALRVAQEAKHAFADGVFWVELARLTDSLLIAQTVAKAVNAVEQPGRPSVEGLLDALQEKKLLLVLDNCEHVLSGCRQLVESLLAATEISVLATSREPLGVTGEILYPVAPMSLPPRAFFADDIGQFDAIQLFVERARAIVPPFELTHDNAEEIANICRHLDGIPLAIELASARVNVLTVEQIAARLENRFEALSSATPITHSHHRTLRAAIDWSYDLLIPSEQVMLRRLAVFADGCSLTTVESVCAGDGIEGEQVLDLLSSLVNKSLVVARTLQRGEARYTLLETIRQYAREKLTALGEWTVMRDRHLRCFLQLTEEAAPRLAGQYQQMWLNWLEQEYDNIRAVLTWALESQHIEVGLRIAVALYQFWTIRDYVEEGFSWLERLLAQADTSVSPVIHANALAYASFMAGFRGHTSEQMRFGQEATIFAEAAGDEGKLALAWALAAQAYGARAMGNYDAEFVLAKREIQLYRELGDPYQLGLSLSTSSFSAMSVGKYDEARAMLDEGLALLREAGNPYRIAMALNFSGDLARCEQKYALAQTAYEECIALLRNLDAVRDLASALHNLGHACLHRGDVDRATTLFHESMALQRAQRNTPGVAECLIGFASLAVACGLPAAAARLLAAAVVIGGERVATAWAATRMEYEHTLALVRANLTTTEFQVEQVAGRAFSIDEAVFYAQRLPFEESARTARRKPVALTTREREVASLIAFGKSNREIAEELVVSKRTVESHIANILSKLGFTNRAQIVRWALETGLVKSLE